MRRKELGAYEEQPIPASKNRHLRSVSFVTACIAPGLLLLAGCGATGATGSATSNRSAGVPTNAAASTGNATNAHQTDSFPSSNGSPTSADNVPVKFTAVDMVSAKDGWATGVAGGQQALWRSTYGGMVWARVSLPFQASGKGAIKFSMSPAGTTTLYVAEATSSGVLTYATTDGGKTWNLLGTANTSDTMVSYFHFVNSSDGWLVTDNGVAMHQSAYHLFHSTDGGKTWQLVAETNSSGSLAFVPGYGDASFSFSPSGVGWMTGQGAVNDKGFLMRSADGRKTWADVPVPVPAADTNTLVTTFRPVYGTDGTVSIPVEYQGQNQNSLVVLQMNSSGQVSSRSAPLQTDKPVAVDFLNPSDGWATTAPWAPNHPQVWRTTNGGRSWNALPVNQQMPGLDAQLQFVTATTGFAFAANQTSFPPVLWQTSDGGNTWRQQVVKVYVTGGPSTPGQNPPPPPPQFTPAQIDFVSDKIGYLSGTYGNGVKDVGRVYKTTDGGENWVEIYHGGSGISSIDALGNTVWVDVGRGAEGPGSKGALLVSTDGGGHFTQLLSKSLASIDFVSKTDGWAVLPSQIWNGKLLYTHDGGQTWTVESLPEPKKTTADPYVSYGSPSSVSFADASHGLVLEINQPGAGEQPKSVLSTGDGAKTWSPIATSATMGASGGTHQLPIGGYANGIDVVPGHPAEAYIWESRGPMIFSSDGGQTWTAVPLTKPDLLEASWVSMRNASDGYVLVHDMSTGSSRFVLEKTTDGMKTWTTVHQWG